LSSEQYGFVFAVIFITVFAGLTAMIPVDLQGQGTTANIQIPVDPKLVSDFTDSATFTRTDFSGVIISSYVYDGDTHTFPFTFECDYASSTFIVGAHVLWFGLWLGAYDWVQFVNDNGTIYTAITFADIDNDASAGSVRYSLIFTGTGQDAGAFVFYYNTTTYTDASDAWDNDELYLIHGYGMTPNTNIISLLVGILFLQLPDVPVGINLLIATPEWASIIYIIWFLIKESLPFF
jgi:hypothetical protein